MNGSIDVKSRVIIALAASAGLTLTACEYVRLLRPSVLKQLNPRVVRLVNELPEVDQPNEAIIGRLFAHGGLSYAQKASDGVFRDWIYVPKDQYIWYPAVIVMEHGGELSSSSRTTTSSRTPRSSRATAIARR